MLKVRILTSVASAGWSFMTGEVIDETHDHFADALALTGGPCADLFPDPTPAETATAPPKQTAAARRR